MAQTRSPPDPFMAFRYTVELSGSGEQVIGGFSDMTGLAAETEVETLRAGGINSTEIQLAGATKFPSRLVLKRGVGDPVQLWRWYHEIMGGKITRKNVRIVIQSADGASELAWEFLQACPVKWTGPELHAATSAISFESIELVHKGILSGPST